MPGVYEVERLQRDGTWVRDWAACPKPIPLRLVIRNALLGALAYTEGDQAWASRELGIAERVMGYQMRAHSIPLAGGTRTIDPRGQRKDLPHAYVGTNPRISAGQLARRARERQQRRKES